MYLCSLRRSVCYVTYICTLVWFAFVPYGTYRMLHISKHSQSYSTGILASVNVMSDSEEVTSAPVDSLAVKVVF